MWSCIFERTYEFTLIYGHLFIYQGAIQTLWSETDSPDTHFHSLLDILVYQWCLNQILYRDY